MMGFAKSDKTKQQSMAAVFTLIFINVIFAILFAASIASSTYAFAPSAPTIITNISSSFPNPTAGTMVNNSGGEIVTMVINATSQNYRWKGYVGNISGRFSLMDSSLRSIYDWQVSVVTGELYATRYSGPIDWASIGCANDALVLTEQTALNISSGSPDTILATFSDLSHRAFYTGPKYINPNTCKSIALNVNGQKQANKFQEVLMTDGNALIYTSLLENRTVGFDGEVHDFQMIVAENALPGAQQNTAYYFYVELMG